MLTYFAIMWAGSYAIGKAAGLSYPRTTLAFSAAGNNFELAVAVAIGVFGVTSGQALAGVVGPGGRARHLRAAWQVREVDAGRDDRDVVCRDAHA